MPDELIGSEEDCFKDIILKFKGFGYDVRVAMADTIGTAWAVNIISDFAIL